MKQCCKFQFLRILKSQVYQLKFHPDLKLQEPFWTTLVVCVLKHAWGSIQHCWTGSFRAPKRSWIQMDAFGSLSSVVTLLALAQLWYVAGWSFSLSWYCMFSQWISLDTYLHVTFVSPVSKTEGRYSSHCVDEEFFRQKKPLGEFKTPVLWGNLKGPC